MAPRETESENKEQKAAERAVPVKMEGGEPFLAAVSSTRMPMVFSYPRQPGNPIIFVNDSFLEMTGYEREEVLGQSYHFMMGPDTDPAARDQIEAAFEEGFGATYPEVLYYRKDGSTFWAIVLIGPVFGEDGSILQHFASFVDVTQRKREEQRALMMLDELDHRVKNTLATVQAIASQSLSGSAVDRDIRDVFQGRILALSKGHTLLAQEDWARASLRGIAEQILEPFGVNEDQAARFSIDGDDVFLKPDAALAFAMMFHELASNAAKYGALSNDAGHVDIVWRTESGSQGEQLRLTWRERGGPPVARPEHKGFGSRLIERMLAKEIDGEVSLSYEPGGAVCEVVMPVPEKS